MDTIGPVIRLDSEDDFRPIKLFRDWHVDELNCLVYHRPRKLLFFIQYTPPEEGGWVQPLELSAHLVHICDGAKVPRAATLRKIGKDCIHAFVVMAEVCQNPAYRDDIPF